MEQMHVPMPAAASLFASARLGNWFVPKIPPLLAIAYLEILRLAVPPNAAARLLASGLLSIFCVASYGHIINDIFDQNADRLANKVNRLASVRPVYRVLLTVAFLIGGFVPALIAHYSFGALSLLALNYLWPTIYSIPGTRLKEKGLLGVACDALGSHITPTLFVLALFAKAAPAGSSRGQVGFALVATIWAGVLGLKGILHHQIADRDNDVQSGIATVATRTSLETLQRFLARYNLLIELPVSAIFSAMVFPWCPLATTAFFIYTGLEAVKYKLGFQFALSANPATIRPSVPFTNEMFYVLWMPMAAATQIALDGLALLWVPLLHAAAFHRPVAQQIGDWRAIVKNATLVYRDRAMRQAH